MLIKLAKNRPTTAQKIKIINCNQTVKDVFRLVNIASIINIKIVNFRIGNHVNKKTLEKQGLDYIYGGGGEMSSLLSLLRH